MGSENKYETKTMKAALEMAIDLESGRVDKSPLSKPFPGPGKNGAEEASSINHRMQGYGTNLLRACIVEDEREVLRLASILSTLLAYQLTTAFECLPGGRGCEQRSPSHKKQHYQYAGLIAYTSERFGRKFGLESLHGLAVSWLQASLSIDSLFIADSPSPRGKVPAILQPGFRAVTVKGRKMVGGRDFIAEDWYRVARLRQPVPSSVLKDPLKSVDQASLWFYEHLSTATKDHIAQHRNPPPLLFPITLQRRGDNFIGSLDYAAIKAQGGREIQTVAGWVNGKEVYGFDEDQVPVLEGATVSLIGAASTNSPVTNSPVITDVSTTPPVVIATDPVPNKIESIVIPNLRTFSETLRSLSDDMKSLADKLESRR